MATLLVRYSEIGLKTPRVRNRFERILKDNILSMFMADGVEAFIDRRGSRFYVECEDPVKTIASLRKVFGVGSISETVVCSSDMEDICRTAAEYSKGRISAGQSFAVDARREGTHPYTSMDVGREAGSAIFLANEGVKVDLTSPDIKFFVEVRDNRAYVFQDYIRAHAGLPIGSQGKVVAQVDDERGMVSAWLLMKRGCRVLYNGTYGIDALRQYDPELRECNDTNSKYALAYCFGYDLDKVVNGFDPSAYDLPVFFPTVGMGDDEVSSLAETIRAGL
ncbi:MAG: hypothetical protein IJ856_04860 [Candidatus Methanomethylophilaceae archaeon]|nr:hypothetical protein [Candidatus Methanomethylophilaceae archaeon]